jgi:hypothetical protein
MLPYYGSDMQNKALLKLPHFQPKLHAQARPLMLAQIFPCLSFSL